MTDILKVNHLTKEFGRLRAVDDLSFEVREGEILGVIGPNGAGKTTVFNLLTGVFKPDEGSILFKGKDIT
ncbi:MAG: ATP-binding cassette domain-containing protein, partial [Deltaproteobacteria bacterium]|nr:ATP-binding cassette domain-containing protein [Deltaproteobacteria bacterium]